MLIFLIPGDYFLSSGIKDWRAVWWKIMCFRDIDIFRTSFVGKGKAKTCLFFKTIIKNITWEPAPPLRIPHPLLNDLDPLSGRVEDLLLISYFLLRQICRLWMCYTWTPPWNYKSWLCWVEWGNNPINFIVLFLSVVVVVFVMVLIMVAVHNLLSCGQ